MRAVTQHLSLLGHKLEMRKHLHHQGAISAGHRERFSVSDAAAGVLILAKGQLSKGSE